MSEAMGVGLGRRLTAMVLMGFALLALVAAPALAQKPKQAGQPPQKAGAGQLDTSFGKGGKVTVAFPAGSTGKEGPQYTLPFEFTPGHLEMARAPGGKVVVAGATKMVRYLASGKLDTSFGHGGTVDVPRPPGGVFVLVGVDVDSAGRVVLAGQARQVPPNSTPDPVQSSAAVMRFNVNGSPDASFGNGGMLITTFGLAAPKAATGPYPSASVGLGGLTIDSQNRILVTGGEVTELSCSTDVDAEGFVTRLTESGAVDQNFGFHKVEGLVRVGEIQARPNGYLAVSSGRPTCKNDEGPEAALIGIDPNGNLDSGFASFGFRTIDFVYPPQMAVMPNGKILLIDSHPYRITVGKGKKRHRQKVQTIERLLPSGAADPSFKRNGRVNIALPKHGSLSALAVDSSGQILVAGKLTKRVSKSPKNKLRRSTFLVTRLDADGNVDKSFGNHGSLTTGFGGPTDSFATQVILDSKGGILVGGGLTAPEFQSGGGFAIAKYLP